MEEFIDQACRYRPMAASDRLVSVSVSSTHTSTMLVGILKINRLLTKNTECINNQVLSITAVTNLIINQ